jgi:hypothetical protein
MPRSYSSATAKCVGLVILGGLGHRRHHALPHARLPQLAQPSLDGRIALGLPEFLLPFAQRHLEPLESWPVLEQVIGGGDDREDRHPRRRACAWRASA